MGQLTPDHLITDLPASVIPDAPEDQQIPQGVTRRRKSALPPARLTLARYARPVLDASGQPTGETVELLDRPPVPREPGDEPRIAAVQAAERGLAVFELRPGEKLPQCKGWQYGQVDGAFVPGRAATHNAGAVWRRWTLPDGSPAQFNVGVFTDDLLVLDFDAGKAEPIDKAEARLCAEIDRRATAAGFHVLDAPAQRDAWRTGAVAGPVTSPFRAILDNAFQVRTGGGGRHYYFRMPDGRRAKNSTGDVLPRAPGEKSCIDVRGAGGLVVAPGSRTAKGEYTITRDCPILPAPEALIQLCGEAGQARDCAEHGTLDWGAETPPGRLADALAYLTDPCTPVSVEGQGGDAAAYAVACGLHDRGVSPADAVALLAEHWNPNCAPPWSDDDLADKVRNAFAYAENPFACRAADVVFAGVTLPEPASVARPASRVHLFADQGEQPAPSWLVKGLLPRVGIGLLAGQSRIGKSFIAHDVCGAVASGASFFGHRVREPFATLYVAAEGAGTAPRRLEALRVHKLGNVDRASLPIAYAALGEPCKPGNVQPFRSLVVEAARELQARFGLRLGLVVLDTVAAAFADLDENDNGQATTAMTALARVGTECGLFVLAVHHFGKDGGTGARGASGWTASADVILAATGKVDEATGQVSGRKLALTKARDGEQQPISDFELHQVHQGVDEDGDPITSAIVRPVSKGAQAFVRDTPKMQALRKAIEFVLIDRADVIEGERWARRDFVRDEFLELKGGSQQKDNVNKDMRAAIAGCTADGTITILEHLGRSYLRLSAPRSPASLF